MLRYARANSSQNAGVRCPLLSLGAVASRARDARDATHRSLLPPTCGRTEMQANDRSNAPDGWLVPVEMGMHVELHSLSRDDLNGRCG